jgi:hypothetical protein
MKVDVMGIFPLHPGYTSSPAGDIVVVGAERGALLLLLYIFGR